MTETLAPVDHASPAARRPPRYWVLLGATVTLALVSLTLAVVLVMQTWAHAVSTTVRYVEIRPGANLACADGKVPFQEDPYHEDSGRFGYLTTYSPTLRCEMTLTFVNHGRHDVRIVDAAFELLMFGRQNLYPVQLRGQTTPEDPHAAKGDDTTAVFDVDQTLAPGKSTELVMELVANNETCDAAGLSSLSGLPRVRVVTLHRHRTIQGSLELATLIKHKISTTC